MMGQKFSVLSVLLFQLAAFMGGWALHICRQSHVAKYDELDWEEPYKTGELDPTANSIPNGYEGLDYNNFKVDKYDGFVIPASGSQFAKSFAGRGNISVHDKRHRSSLSLISLNYACTGGVPQAKCFISIWGFRGKHLVAHRVITFPALEPGHYSNEFVTNSTTFDKHWHRLTSVGFQNATPDDGDEVYEGLMIDDLRYTIEGECGSYNDAAL